MLNRAVHQGESAPAESRGERRFDYDRTVAISDGVFAIALTLLVLNIGTPILGPGRQALLGQRLLDHWSEFFSYALGFAVISLLWVEHHSFFREVERINSPLTVINLTYLGLVAFLPYPTGLLGRYDGQTAAVVLFAAAAGAVGLVNRLMLLYAMRAGLLSNAGRNLAGRRASWATPVVFGLSIPIAFLSVSAAPYCWLLLVLVPRLPKIRSRLHRR